MHDMMHFEVGGPSEAQGPRPRMARFDAALCAHGVRRRAGKDVDRATNATCIGIEVCDARRAVPAARRHAQLIQAVLEVCRRPRCSSRRLAAMLGHCTWPALLNRPAFSAFHAVYAAAKEISDAESVLSDAVLSELLNFVALTLLLAVDLGRLWGKKLDAMGASLVYGFGVTAMDVDEQTHRVFGYDTRAGCSFLRIPDAVDTEEQPRRRTFDRLGLDFADLVLGLLDDHLRRSLCPRALWGAGGGGSPSPSDGCFGHLGPMAADMFCLWARSQ